MTIFKKRESSSGCLVKVELYEVSLDLNIEKAIAQAIDISRKNGVIVRFLFNQIEMNIQVPKIKSKKDVDYYQQFYTKEYCDKNSRKKYSK